MAAASIPVKQGSTLSIGAVFQLNDGTPIDISAATIACSFRDALGTAAGTAAIARMVATGAATISLTPEQSAALPVGEVFGDILLQLPSGVFFSDTFGLSVSASITPGGI